MDNLGKSSPALLYTAIQTGDYSKENMNTYVEKHNKCSCFLSGNEGSLDGLMSM